MQVPCLRVCLVHRLYLDLPRFIKKIIRLMPSYLALLGLITLLLLTLVQMVTVQPEFVSYQTLPEPSELIRTKTNSTNSTHFLNNYNVHTDLTSSPTLPRSSIASFNNYNNLTSLSSTNSLAYFKQITNSITKQSDLTTPITNLRSIRLSKSANLTNLNSNLNSNLSLNRNEMDQLNRSGLSHMIISSNRSSLFKAKKNDPFKIEALLSKSPSAFQTNNREMNSLTNKGRIKQIIKTFLSEQRLQKEELKNLTLFLNDTSHNSNSPKLNQTFEHCPLLPPNLGKKIFKNFFLFL